MKRLIALLLVMVCVFSFSACGKKTYSIGITIPAGSTDAFVYSDQQICPTGRKITLRCGEGLGDAEVILKPVDETLEMEYVGTYITPGLPVEFDTVKGEWLCVGVFVQNPTDSDIVVYVDVEGVDVRIE